MPNSFINIVGFMCNCSSLIIGVSGLAYRIYVDHKKAHSDIVTFGDLTAFGEALNQIFTNISYNEGSSAIDINTQATGATDNLIANYND